ncbi:MAG: caspase family protein [Salinivirgaceae bacterium]|nr:caspase family protein [Salinivirgaceae bacterium]
MDAKTGKGFSLFIGLNSVDPMHYGGWNGNLRCCENDVDVINKMTKLYDYENIETLKTHKATRNNVQASFKKAAEILQPGDTLFLYYSGHGGYLLDEDLNDEQDNQDETWCLFDGQLIDDEIYSNWTAFKKGVKIIMISDSCHSGTISKSFSPCNADQSKNMPFDVSDYVYEKHKDFYKNLLRSKKGRQSQEETIEATILLISACQDNQQAIAGFYNSLFTNKLLKIWNQGKFVGDYRKYHGAIVSQMPPTQTPNYVVIGAANKEFEKQKPFVIT